MVSQCVRPCFKLTPEYPFKCEHWANVLVILQSIFSRAGYRPSILFEHQQNHVRSTKYQKLTTHSVPIFGI